MVRTERVNCNERNVLLRCRASPPHRETFEETLSMSEVRICPRYTNISLDPHPSHPHECMFVMTF